MTGWLFLYACVTAACSHGIVAVEGDGRYYATRAQCMQAARADARRWRMPGREIICAQRSEPR